MYYTVDRIEGDFAVVEAEDGKMSDINLKDLPKNVKEGDILNFVNNIYIIDKERTKQTKKDLEERFKKLFLK